MTFRTAWFRISSTLLLAYLGLFVILSVDVIARLWSVRSGMGSAFEAALVLCYQAGHAMITLFGMVLAARMLLRERTPATRAFGLMLAFLTLWYAMAFAFTAFPGRFQSWLAANLFELGLPSRVAGLFFDSPWWPAWLALAACVRVSVLYPQPVTSEAIAAAGQRDRTGLMRSVACAGVDVGAVWRTAAAFLLQRGLLRGAVVWPAALALGLASALLAAPSNALLPVYALFGAGAAIVITNVRAGMGVATALARRRILWIVQAALTAVIAFLVAGVLSFPDDGAASVLSFALTAVAPLAVMTGIALAARASHPPDPRQAVRNTASRGTVAFACAAAYVIVQSLTSSTGGPAVLGSMLGFLAAIATGVLVWRRARASMVRLITPAFARPES